MKVIRTEHFIKGHKQFAHTKGTSSASSAAIETKIGQDSCFQWPFLDEVGWYDAPGVSYFQDCVSEHYMHMSPMPFCVQCGCQI